MPHTFLSSSVLSHGGQNSFGVRIIRPNRLPIAFVKAQFLDLLMDAFQDIEDEIEAEQVALDDAAAECDIFEEEVEDS